MAAFRSCERARWHGPVKSRGVLPAAASRFEVPGIKGPGIRRHRQLPRSRRSEQRGAHFCQSGIFPDIADYRPPSQHSPAGFDGDLCFALGEQVPRQPGRVDGAALSQSAHCTSFSSACFDGAWRGLESDSAGAQTKLRHDDGCAHPLPPSRPPRSAIRRKRRARNRSRTKIRVRCENRPIAITRRDRRRHAPVGARNASPLATNGEIRAFFRRRYGDFVCSVRRSTPAPGRSGQRPAAGQGRSVAFPRRAAQTKQPAGWIRPRRKGKVALTLPFVAQVAECPKKPPGFCPNPSQHAPNRS